MKAPGYQRYLSPRGEDAFEGVLELVAGSTQDYTATIRLEPAGIVTGRIIAPEGVPAGVFSVEVRALDAPGHERTNRFELVEDDGSFRVELPLTGLYKLEADGSFDGKSYAASMEVRPGDLNIEVRPVFDGEDSFTRDIPEPKGPVSWWDVEVVGPEGKIVKRVWLSVHAAQGGACAVRHADQPAPQPGGCCRPLSHSRSAGHSGGLARGGLRRAGRRDHGRAPRCRAAGWRRRGN